MVIMETEYLLFEEHPTKNKTKFITVVNKNSEDIIGEIKWYAPWRQYCFFPEFDTVWNTKCLDDVNDLIKKLMKDRRVKK